MPPGAPNWRLPPPERKMIFIGLPSEELCRRLKDKRENHGMDLEALLRHVASDKLVLWGWSPERAAPPSPSRTRSSSRSSRPGWTPALPVPSLRASAGSAPCGRTGE